MNVRTYMVVNAVLPSHGNFGVSFIGVQAQPQLKGTASSASVPMHFKCVYLDRGNAAKVQKAIGSWNLNTAHRFVGRVLRANACEVYGTWLRKSPQS